MKIKTVAELEARVALRKGGVDGYRTLETKPDGSFDVVVKRGDNISCLKVSDLGRLDEFYPGTAEENTPAVVPTVKAASFWTGTWHGVMILVTFVNSLFTDGAHVYKVQNSGESYDVVFWFSMFIFVCLVSSIVYYS